MLNKGKRNLKECYYQRKKCLKCNDGMEYAPLSDLLRQANIETNNQFMDFFDSSWQDCLDTGRSTGAYIIFYQGGTIDHDTRVTVTVDQSSA